MSMDSPSMNSYSSSFMLGLTLYRNREGNKCLAQAGYAFTTAAASVESVVALTLCVGAFAICPATPKPFERSAKWLGSSSFCIVWSAADFFMNPFVPTLVADEKSARKIAKSGNLMSLPLGAVI